jgi:hypothetical protein
VEVTGRIGRRNNREGDGGDGGGKANTKRRGPIPAVVLQLSSAIKDLLKQN